MLHLGIDIGVTSIKAALLGDKTTNLPEGHAKKTLSHGLFFSLLPYRRIFGKPEESVDNLMVEIHQIIGDLKFDSITVTGSGAKLIAARIGADVQNEFKAIAASISLLYPSVRTIFEMGGESSKYILLERAEGATKSSIIDYGINGDCAAGTGSFIDQQVKRLHYKVEDIGDIIKCAERTASVAGRCSVFAKSDMVHAQQRGYKPAEVMKGLCVAVARNFKGSIVKGREIKTPIAFIGGLSQNSAMIGCLREALELPCAEILVPAEATHLGAIGAALIGADAISINGDNKKITPHTSRDTSSKLNIPTLAPLITTKVLHLRDKARPAILPKTGRVDAYLGIDIGSVSTNLVLINKEGELITDIYTYTKARPIEVVGDALQEIEQGFGDRITIKGVGTTGSGRELIGELVGADTIRDEITAHKTGALHIAKTLTDGKVDTIFEIGGQDSKYIRIEDGIVTDFTMNEACAAGTGSFLEEQAERLGLKIKEEFATVALTAKTPIDMGARCTVFIERDLNAYQLAGAQMGNIVAGLAYSIVHNYLNRVVRGRKIGNHIYFQGGTAYNDAVAAAFSIVLGKTITVPPHNGVMGAVGAALLAKDTITNNPAAFTKFRGFDLGQVDYNIREFTCNACSNLCNIQEFTVEGSKTYWGDKCSSKFRKAAKANRQPTIPDLFQRRDDLLFAGHNSKHSGSKLTVGIPRGLYFYDRFQLWRTYFEELGCHVLVSPPTNHQIAAKGAALAVAEPCHPINIAHGHLHALLERNVDLIWMPNMISSEPHLEHKGELYMCPWGQTLPFVTKAVQSFESSLDKFLMPTIGFHNGIKHLIRQMKPVAERLGVSSTKNRKALETAFEAQEHFKKIWQREVMSASENILYSAERAILLLGRPYNIHDAAANLNVASKLRRFYGINVIPADGLDLDAIPIKEFADNMFWNYGRKILAAAKWSSERKNIHAIYITNFKCGPDSFIKHYVVEAAKKPILTLQFDEHSNDAGMLTRVEAFLDSKGFFR